MRPSSQTLVLDQVAQGGFGRREDRLGYIRSATVGRGETSGTEGMAGRARPVRPDGFRCAVDFVSPGRPIDTAPVGHVLDAGFPRQASKRPVDIGAQLALDAEHPVRFRCRIWARKQEHRGVREIHSRIADHPNPVLRVAIEYVARHVGMRGLLHHQAVAPVPADRVADNPGGGSPQHLDTIRSIVPDDIRARVESSVLRTPTCAEALPSTRMPVC